VDEDGRISAHGEALPRPASPSPVPAGTWDAICIKPHARYRSIADAGIRHTIVETFDAADEETIRLSVEQVTPRVAR
jgi:hypothetical protein